MLTCWGPFHHLRHRHHRFAETNHLIGQGLHGKNDCFMWTWHVLPVVIDIRLGDRWPNTSNAAYFGSLKGHIYMTMWGIHGNATRFLDEPSDSPKLYTQICVWNLSFNFNWISTVSKLSETSSPIKEQDTNEHIPCGMEKKKLKQTTQELYEVRQSCGFFPIPFETKNTPCWSP